MNVGHVGASGLAVHLEATLAVKERHPSVGNEIGSAPKSSV